MAQLNDTTIHGTLTLTAGGQTMNILDYIYPIGCMIQLSAAVDPNDYYAGTTWQHMNNAPSYEGAYAWKRTA